MRKICRRLLAICLLLLIGLPLPSAQAHLSTGPQVYETTGPCGENLTYTLENGVLRIEGTGDMYDYGYVEGVGARPRGWDPHGFDKVVIESGVTSIGSWAFGVEHSGVSEVQLPDTLERIGEAAFLDCEFLRSITLPESLVSIGDGAFNGTSLKELVIPRGVTSLGTSILDPEVLAFMVDPKEIQSPAGWAKEELEEALDRSLVTWRTFGGYEQDITRIQVAELAVNLVNKAVAEYIQPSLPTAFPDTSDLMALETHAAGIVNGRDGGCFVPDGTATREEIAVMLCRAAAYVQEHTENAAGLNMSAATPEKYTDRDQVSPWAASSVAALAEAGILTGTSDSTLSPRDNATVQEVILLTLRLYQYILS